MANFELYWPKYLKHEGGFVNHPNDPGGATNMGITLRTFQQHGRDINGDGKIDVADLRAMTQADAKPIIKKFYWDVMRADLINNQDVAEIIVDHGVNAGLSRAAMMVQRILNRDFNHNLTVDGKIGPMTLAALNSTNQAQFFAAYKTLREQYYRYLANDLKTIPIAEQQFFSSFLKVRPNEKFKSFINGWLNRVASFEKKK